MEILQLQAVVTHLARPGGRLRRVATVTSAALLAAIGICSMPSAALAQATSPTPGVLPPWSNSFGRSYSQWSVAQWQWELQQPNDPTAPIVDQNPGTPDNPEAINCALDQSGHVWFLAGISFFQPYSSAYRSCTIRAGVALFFPVIDVWGDNLNCPGLPPFTSTADQLRQFMQQQTDAIDPGSMSATVDGRSVQGLADSSTAYRAAAGGFSYSLPPNNALSMFCPGNPLPAGTVPPPPGAYADGVYIMLAPLSPGVHHLSFTATEFDGSITENVTYTLTVKP